MQDDPLRLLGAVVGDRYEVQSCLEVHGPRVVYQAQHRAWAQPVRLEVLAPSGDPARAEQHRRAFVRAGGVVASLGSRHGAVTHVRDAGIHDGPTGPVAFVATEWVEGHTLAEAIAASGRNRFEPAAVLEWMDPVLDTFMSAHREGVVHGNLDLESLRVIGNLGPRAVFKIDGLVEGAWRPLLQGGALPLRRPTTGFVAPELGSNDATLVGPWTDVYGLAAVLSVLICGSSSAAMRERSLPPGVRYAFDKALQQRIDARFKTLTAFRGSMMEGLDDLGEVKVRNPRATMVVADVDSQLAEGSAGGFEVSDDDADVELPSPSHGKARVRLAFTQPAMSVPDALRNLDIQPTPRAPSGAQPVVPPKPSSNFIALLIVVLVLAVGGGVVVGYLLFR
jgi:hypothetical protein